MCANRLPGAPRLGVTANGCQAVAALQPALARIGRVTPMSGRQPVADMCSCTRDERVEDMNNSGIRGLQWNYFRCNINETIIVRTADALLSTGLANLGYTYVNIDGEQSPLTPVNQAQHVLPSFLCRAPYPHLYSVCQLIYVVEYCLLSTFFEDILARKRG